jgi:hypothetical protein
MARRCSLLLAVAMTLGTASHGAPPPASRPPPPASRPLPRPEPVAETRLLMEGLNQANFQGLERLLRQKPTDTEAWVYARGQALLIAETGNLLLLRPPRNNGRAVWMERAADLRSTATGLARAVAAQDYDQSRAQLTKLAASCTRCHQSFRVPVRVVPFGNAADRDAEPVP